MICPKCSNEMTQVMKHGLAIDTCTACGGVWLDKGELGELMARVSQAGSSLDQELSRVQPPPRSDYDRSRYQERDRHHDDHHDDHYDKYRHKKRSIWDIFD